MKPSSYASRSKPKAVLKNGPSRAGLRRKNSREAILESAIELFSKESIDSVKIRDLERMSGVSAPTIYHFFADKKDLHDHAVREAFARIWSSVYDSIDSGAGPEDSLRQLMAASLRTFSEHNSVMRIFSNEVGQAENEELKAELTAKFFDPAYDIWRAVVNRYSPGAGDGLAPMILLAALVGLGQLAEIRKLATSSPASEPGSDEDTQKIIDILLSTAGADTADRASKPSATPPSRAKKRTTRS